MKTSLGAVVLLLAPAILCSQPQLPQLRDGTIITGPHHFRHDGPLRVSGRVTLRNLTLDLYGPIVVSAGASFELDRVRLRVSDPPGAQNGTSGLKCEGPAHIVVRSSSMSPAGSAHPMWLLKGVLDVDGFETHNSEFHLDHVESRLHRLDIFELEISHASRVQADRLNLVFLSTHTGHEDNLDISGIPSGKTFTRHLRLGSGASADLTSVTAQLFLVYLHGQSHASLSHMGRVQLAIFPRCQGNLRLPSGRLGSDTQPVIVPQPAASNCPFRFTLNDVSVDTWDVYAGGNANLSLADSRIDELTADAHAKLQVRHSEIYADWLSFAGQAELHAEDSTVGALRLARERPDLATSQIRLSGNARAVFTRVRFDCGIVAQDHAQVEIRQPRTPPPYIRQSGSAQIRQLDPAVGHA